jgi:REP element-mobilizing transposase RayT
VRNRQTIRRQGYNYSLPGAYFVTICVQNREYLFGNVENGKMILNKIGEIIKNQWLSIPTRFSNTKLDEFIIMPNHIHGIIIISPARQTNVGATLAVARNEIDAKRAMPVTKRATARVAPTYQLTMNHSWINGQKTNKTNHFTIGQIIGAFKSLCITNYLKYIKNKNLNTPLNKLWQRNYYEHIIRNENELNYVRQYIKDNPIKWRNDNYYRPD